MKLLPLLVNLAKLPAVTHCLELLHDIHQSGDYKQLLAESVKPSLVMMRSQPRTAFGAAALDDQTTCFGAHSDPKAMRFSAAAIVRLKSALHSPDRKSVV